MPLSLAGYGRRVKGIRANGWIRGLFAPENRRPKAPSADAAVPGEAGSGGDATL